VRRKLIGKKGQMADREGEVGGREVVQEEMKRGRWTTGTRKETYNLGCGSPDGRDIRELARSPTED
jgi:hypothetical protein